MTITTKYDIGQEVWAIVCGQDTYPVYDLPPGYPRRETEPATYTWKSVGRPMMIEHAAASRLDSSGVRIVYSGDPTIWWGSYAEDNCFPTELDAQTECDKRNGK